MKSTGISLATLSIVVLAILSLFGIQIVAAQISATSSEPIATSTEVTADTGEALTTPTVEMASTTTPIISTETAPSTEPAPAESTPVPPPPPEPTTAAQDAVALEVLGLEDAYMQKTGRYLQVIAGNQLPTYENGSVASKLGKNIPDYVSIDVYESADGKGYQIYFEQNGTLYSYGFGPEASVRSYTLQPPVSVATSTPVTQ